eukprot:m51a1_g3084 putative nephrocystin-4 isoform x4 (1349) ;mRNA; r:57935-63195
MLSQEEVRLAQQWVRFFNSKRTLPLAPPAPPLSPPARIDHSTPLCLSVLDACFVPVPPAIFEGLPEACDVMHRFQITPYDLVARRFFGNTFSSDPVPGEGRLRVSETTQQDNVFFHHAVFLHSSLTDQRCVFVFELVIVVKNEAGVTLREASAGWGVFSPFGNPSRLRDLSEGEAARVGGATEQVYLGTPRALLILDAPDVPSLKKQLVPLQSCRLAYTLHTNKVLSDYMCYLKENELVDESSVVPGLARAPVDSEAEAALERSGKGVPQAAPSPLVYTPLAEPMPLETVAVFIGDVVIHVADGFNQGLLEEMDRIRLSEYGIDPPDGEKASIVQKFITIGVHNGRTFVRSPHRGVLEEREGRLVHDTSISFSSVVPHVLFAIVFQVEYVVRLPLNARAQQLFSHPGSVDRTVAVGWFPFIPFTGQEYRTGETAVPMQAGPLPSPVDGVPVYCPPQHQDSQEQAVAPVSLRFRMDVPMEAPGLSPFGSTGLGGTFGTRPQSSASMRPPAQSDRLDMGQDLQNDSDRSQRDSGRSPRGGPATPRQDDLGPLSTQNPSYAPIPADLARATPSSTSQWRASRADLVGGDKFPPLVDDSGKPSEEVGVIGNLPGTYTSSKQPDLLRPDFKAEAADRRKGNDVYILFMGFNRVNSPNSWLKSDPRTVFFTLQFWKYPMIRTARVGLGQQMEPTGVQVFYQLDESDALTLRAGLPLHFFGQGEFFLRYMAQRTLQVDVWDGDTLFHLGSANIDLRPIMRRGRPAVQFTECYDVVFHERVLPPKAEAGDVIVNAVTRQVVRGVVHVRLSNVGSVTDRVDAYGMQSPTLVTPQRTARFSAVEVIDASKMSEKDEELRRHLQRLRPDAGVPDDMDPEMLMRRKQARIQLAKQKLGKTADTALEAAKRQRERELRVVQVYRDKRKPDVVSAKLREYVTTTHTIYPSFGVPCFFEYAFKNPYPTEHCFSISVSDPELSLIKTREEWILFKQYFNLYMQPGETVHMPFKFQSWKCGRVLPQFYSPENAVTCDSPLLRVGPEPTIERRQILASVMNERGVVVAQVCVSVEPQPFVVDHTFWFFHFENDLFKQSIRLAQQSSAAPCFLRCSTESVIYGTQQKSREGQEVFFKCRCGPAGDVMRFYLLIYEDKFQVSLRECWQVFVHSFDLAGQMGQTTAAGLVVRGPATSRVANCHSSVPEELRIATGSANGLLTLVAGATNEVSSYYLPLAPGRREVFVHLVDSELHELAHAWVVYTMASAPAASKVFRVELSASAGHSKRVSYTNPYGYEKALRLRTNEPRLMRFKEETLALAGHESKYVSMVFVPQSAPPPVTDIYVFINDADNDKTIDCFIVKAVYKP